MSPTVKEALEAYIAQQTASLKNLAKILDEPPEIEPVRDPVPKPPTPVVDASLLAMVSANATGIGQLKQRLEDVVAMSKTVTKAVISLGERQNLEWVDELKEWTEKSS